MKLTQAPNWAGWLAHAAQMVTGALTGRNLAMAGAALLAAGCQVIPKTDVPVATASHCWCR
jgi:branched-chain amino acid transport system substrate-binding protein